MAKGHELFREGAPADCAYAVAAGSFALSNANAQGRQQQVMTVGRGALLSELALISMVERKFTATAQADSEVIRINRPLFRRMLEEYPEVTAMVEARIRENIQAMIRRVEALAGRFA